MKNWMPAGFVRASWALPRPVLAGSRAATCLLPIQKDVARHSVKSCPGAQRPAYCLLTSFRLLSFVETNCGFTIVATMPRGPSVKRGKIERWTVPCHHAAVIICEEGTLRRRTDGCGYAAVIICEEGTLRRRTDGCGYAEVKSSVEGARRTDRWLRLCHASPLWRGKRFAWSNTQNIFLNAKKWVSAQNPVLFYSLSGDYSLFSDVFRFHKSRYTQIKHQETVKGER